jgi:Family of unknown function (DUF6521)
LLFGGVHGLLLFTSGLVSSDAARRRTVNSVLRVSTDEVRACAKRAEFIGKWFAKAGTPGTIMALMGVKP